MIYCVQVLLTIALVLGLILWQPAVRLAIGIYRCRLSIRWSLWRIKNIERRVSYFKSEAYVVHLRARGRHQDEGMIRYVQDEEIRRCEYLLRVYRTSLRGEREILTNLLKLHEQRAKLLDDMALRKKLAENVSRAEELQKQLERLSRERNEIEHALAAMKDKPGYRVQQPLQLNVRVTEELEEIDEALNEGSVKKRAADST